MRGSQPQCWPSSQVERSRPWADPAKEMLKTAEIPGGQGDFGILVDEGHLPIVDTHRCRMIHSDSLETMMLSELISLRNATKADIDHGLRKPSRRLRWSSLQARRSTIIQPHSALRMKKIILLVAMRCGDDAIFLPAWKLMPSRVIGEIHGYNLMHAIDVLVIKAVMRRWRMKKYPAPGLGPQVCWQKASASWSPLGSREQAMLKWFQRRTPCCKWFSERNSLAHSEAAHDTWVGLLCTREFMTCYLINWWWRGSLLYSTNQLLRFWSWISSEIFEEAGGGIQQFVSSAEGQVAELMFRTRC